MKRGNGAKRSVGPRMLSGSAQAKRLAVVVLEVLSGLRDARGGSRAMGVSLNRKCSRNPKSQDSARQGTADVAAAVLRAGGQQLVGQEDGTPVGECRAGGGAKVGLGVDPGELGRFDQAVEQRRHLGAASGA
jgi:hypothetical protein